MRGAPLRHPSSGIAALVLGILGLTALPIIGSVLALIFGYQARREAEASPEIYTDDFGRVGRILGWVGLALFALFAVIMVVSGVLFLLPQWRA